MLRQRCVAPAAQVAGRCTIMNMSCSGLGLPRPYSTTFGFAARDLPLRVHRFRLLNMRHAARFVLLRNGFEFPTAAASSENVEVENPNEPTGGHLALTGKQG